MALSLKSSVSGSAVRANRPQVQRAARSGVVCRADGAFLGSPTNLIMLTTTSLALASGRFGLAPTVKKNTTAGLKLVDSAEAAGLISNDPAGFTVVDVLGHGAVGHALGVGIVLGLKGIGAL